MKHLLFVVIGVVVSYGLWQVISPIERRHASRVIARHGLRLGALLMVALLLLALAYYIPSSNIL